MLIESNNLIAVYVIEFDNSRNPWQGISNEQLVSTWSWLMIIVIFDLTSAFVIVICYFSLIG